MICRLVFNNRLLEWNSETFRGDRVLRSFSREALRGHADLFGRPSLEICYLFNKGTRSNTLGGVFALTRALAEKGGRATKSREKRGGTKVG